MSLPIAPIDIVRLAADQIGEALANTIEPPVTEIEKRFARAYDHTRQRVIRMGVWNCAKARASISRDATAPAFGFPDRYLLPNDCLRFLRFDNSITSITDFDNYEIEGRYVLVNAGGAASINIHYITDVTEVALWDAGLRELIILFLAKAVAYQSTKKKELIAILNDSIKLEMPDAFSIDGQERPPRRKEKSRALNSRRRINGNSGYPGRFTVFDS